MKKVSILVLCYNEKKFIKTLLDSLKEQDYKGEIQTIVVDNASTDGSTDFVEDLIAKDFTNVQFIKNDKNIGTPGFNLALPHVKGEYVMWVGSDTKFAPSCVSEMVKYLDDHPKVGGIYPHVLDWEGMYLEGWYRFSRTLYFFSILGISEEKEYSAIGPGMMRKEILDVIDYIYDDDYFYSYEDVDLCLRMRLLGWPTEYFKDGILYHRGSISFNTQQKKAKLVYLGDRNALITLLKIDQIHTLAWVLPYTLAYRGLLILKELVTLRWKFAAARTGAVLYPLFHIPMIWKKRRGVQKYRKKSDEYVYKIADEKGFIQEAFKKLIGRETFDVNKFHKKYRKEKN